MKIKYTSTNKTLASDSLPSGTLVVLPANAIDRKKNIHNTFKRRNATFPVATDKTSMKGTMDPEGSACNSCNSWPLYAR